MNLYNNKGNSSPTFKKRGVKMKIKLIKSEKLQFGINDFESTVNEFIKFKKIIDIKYQEYSDEDGISANVLIMYEEE